MTSKINIEVREIPCIQMKHDTDPYPVSILPGDSVEFEIGRKGEGVIKVLCLVKTFDKDNINVWDIRTDQDYTIPVKDVRWFEIKLRGYGAYKMFGGGENPYEDAT